MEPQTGTQGNEAAPPAVKLTIEQELAAAFKAESEAAAKGAETKVEAQAPAPSEGGTPETEAKGEEKKEGETVEAPKVEEKPTTLARRLALVARAEREAKAKKEADAKADADKAARDKEIAPIIDRITKAKSAKSKMEAAATVLGLDEDGIAELYLELHKHMESAPDEKKPADPMANLEATVAKLLDAKLKERDETEKTNREKALNKSREDYTAITLSVLETKGDDFPLVAIAPPSQVDITAISEAWLVANGEIPEPESVLKLIQDARQKALDERSAKKSTGAKTEGTTTAPAEKPGENSGSTKAKPARPNEVGLKPPPRKLTIAEEFTAAYREATGQAT